MTVQIKSEVPSKTSAQVNYVATSLGIKVSETYSLIIQAYLYDMGLDQALDDIGDYLRRGYVSKEPLGSETGKARD